MIEIACRIVDIPIRRITASERRFEGTANETTSSRPRRMKPSASSALAASVV
jgi:hypothetical protein